MSKWSGGVWTTTRTNKDQFLWLLCYHVIRAIIWVAIADWKINCHRSLLACSQTQNLSFSCDNGQYWLIPHLFWSTGYIPQSRGRHHFLLACRSTPPTVTNLLGFHISNIDWCHTPDTSNTPRRPYTPIMYIFLYQNKLNNNACNSACTNPAVIFVVC